MMLSRLSPVRIAMAILPLYGGPVLAGWSGHPFAVITAYALIFMAYLLFTRRRMGGVDLLLTGLVQLVLCGALDGIGKLGAMAFGALTLPLWAPLALSGFGAALAGWLYRDMASVERAVDEMQAAIDRLADTMERLDDPVSDAGQITIEEDEIELPEREKPTDQVTKADRNRD